MMTLVTYFVKIPLKQESHVKKKILNNRLIIKDFFGMTSGTRKNIVHNGLWPRFLPQTSLLVTDLVTNFRLLKNVFIEHFS